MGGGSKHPIIKVKRLKTTYSKTNISETYEHGIAKIWYETGRKIEKHPACSVAENYSKKKIIMH